MESEVCGNTDCSDGNQCTQDNCSPLSGQCSNPPEENGTACEEGGEPGTCRDEVCEI